MILSYSDFKTVVNAKGLLWQYVSLSDRYYIFANDNQAIYEATIFFSSTQAQGIDPVAEAANKVDFDANYAPTANAKVSRFGDQAVSPALPYGSGMMGWLQSIWKKHDDGNTTLSNILTAVSIAQGIGANIVVGSEFTMTAKTETAVSGVTRTVSSGKTFYLVAFSATSNSPSPCSYRLKVNGVTKKKIELGAASGATTNQLIFPVAAQLGVAGDVITVTYDAQLNRGGGWTEFVGLER